MRRPKVLAAAVLLTATACMTAPQRIEAPGTFIPANRPDRIWITRTDGTRLMVYEPQIYGDSLLGRTDGPIGQDVLWMGLDQIEAVEARRFDIRRTALAAGGVMAAATAGAIILSSTGPKAEEHRNPDDPVDIIIPLRFLIPFP